MVPIPKPPKVGKIMAQNTENSSILHTFEAFINIFPRPQNYNPGFLRPPGDECWAPACAGEGSPKSDSGILILVCRNERRRITSESIIVIIVVAYDYNKYDYCDYDYHYDCYYS